MSGRVEALWTKRARRGVMDPADRLTLVVGQGIEGDSSYGRSARHVTVIEKEVFDRIRTTFPDADPAMRRANVMVSGVRLRETRDGILTLGNARIHIRGETRPCELMDEQLPGLRDALDPGWGGGVHGVVLDGGDVRVGDDASFEAPG